MKTFSFIFARGGSKSVKNKTVNTNLILKHTHPKHKLRLGDSKPIL